MSRKYQTILVKFNMIYKNFVIKWRVLNMIVKTLHLNPPFKDWNRYFIRSNLYLAPAFLTIFPARTARFLGRFE